MKRIKRKYRLTIEDTSRLRLLRTFNLSLGRLLLLCILAVIVVGLFIYTLILGSPIRNYFSKTSMENQTRKELQVLAEKLDTLQQRAITDDLFMRNLTTVLDTDRVPTDSANAGVLLKSLPVDSLMTGTPAERRFVAAMGEKEKYNLQILAPMDADGMIFSSPVEGGIIAEESANRFLVRLIVPSGEGVNSVADGIVLDTYRTSDSEGYTVIIQHPNGFVSRYTHLSVPLVEDGSTVFSGQRISSPAALNKNEKSGTVVGVELWHDGTPLYPRDYIYRMSN